MFAGEEDGQRRKEDCQDDQDYLRAGAIIILRHDDVGCRRSLFSLKRDLVITKGELVGIHFGKSVG